jgi:mannose-1-phosphate guanylyltransferase
VQAIVLVGGEGTRLRPLTDSIPKPVLTLVDRPFLAYMVEWLGSHGVTEVVFACGFLPDRLREALGEGDRDGIALTYVVEPERRGTAGAIRFAAEALGERLDDRFLALNGDVLTNFDLGLLLRAHAERGARATIGLYGVEDSSAFGLVECDTAGAVVAFTEKTGVAAPGEVNAGAYVLEHSVLDLIAPGRAVSIEREVFPRLVGEGLCATRLDGYWMDIGTPKTYLEATWDILEGRVETSVRATAPGLYIAAGSTVSDAARVGPRAVVSAGCVVDCEAEVGDSVLLDGSSVGTGARVSGSILAHGAVVEPGAQVDDTVVAENERVRAQR